MHNVQPLTGGFWKNWEGFVGVVLALSGVEAIVNATGVMKLNPGTTDAKPNVSKTSTPAILWVMIEVCLFTALLGLAMHALPNLVINKDNVDALPDHPGVRDYMLSYMGQVFVGGALGPLAGKIAAGAVSIIFGALLLSAVNTAIVDLIAISFLMSRDGELPPAFQKLNTHGVPNLGIIAATVIPVILVLVVKDMAGLADLYAVGVVGAIATNLGASSTDKKLDLLTWERLLMFFTFLIMLAIEMSLFWTKPSARVFSGAVLLIGLISSVDWRREFAHKKKVAAAAAESLPRRASAARLGPKLPRPPWSRHSLPTRTMPPITPMMCAVRGLGKTLDFAVEEARECHRPLYLLFVRPVPILSARATTSCKWQDDDGGAGDPSLTPGRWPMATP